MTQRPQDVAEKKMRHARKMARRTHAELVAGVRRTARLVDLLRRWEDRAERYEGRSRLTDAQLQAERDQRKQRAPKPKRGIKIGGAV